VTAVQIWPVASCSEPFASSGNHGGFGAGLSVRTESSALILPAVTNWS